MKLLSLVTRIAIALLLGALSIVALSTSADAAGGIAPSCVKRHVGTTGGMPDGARVTVTNRCAKSKRVKVVFTHAHDSACMLIKPGHSRTVQSNVAFPFSHYDKTVSC